MKTTSAERETLRRLLKEGTPGPWKTDIDCFEPDPPYTLAVNVTDDQNLLFVSETPVVYDGTSVTWNQAKQRQEWRDATLIAHLRNAAERLLDDLDRARELLHAVLRDGTAMAEARRFLTEPTPEPDKERP